MRADAPWIARIAWSTPCEPSDTLLGMKDTDPRPMPPSVQAAYKQPIDLIKLLRTHLYNGGDREAVRDAMLRLLLEKHGEIWIPMPMRSGDVPLSEWAMRGPAMYGIDMILSLEDLGGPEATMPVLARVMQPGWIERWKAMEWLNSRDVEDWIKVSSNILGRRQFMWLSAQYARSVAGHADMPLTSNARRTCLRSLDATEAYAKSP